ncbi:MAG: hypothetical protein O2923_09415 [Verrucomicrobia bacterium]|nr:hypothetical protein [Verrucomicrobiota bacterium]MDA1085821.1 hypothetical protein [Verrucomicrobiota bacterium]
MARRKTRKRNTKMDSSYLLPPPALAVVILASIMALAYISVGERCEDLGREVSRLERDLDAKRKVLGNEQSKWQRLKSKPQVELALKAFGLEMDWPQQNQVLYLVRRPWGQAGQLATANQSATWGQVAN